MDTPPPEELLRKIQELEAGHAHLKEEMSKLKISGSNTVRTRSHSVSPQRPRLPAARWNGSGPESWKKGSSSFGHSSSSPLQRESRSCGSMPSRPAEPETVEFTDKQYVNILQSMGQAVHVFDVNCRLIYWYVDWGFCSYQLGLFVFLINIWCFDLGLSSCLVVWS